MNDKWRSLPSGQSDLDQGLLLAYLEGKLNQEEQGLVEKMMAESEFMADAMEGLSAVSDKKKIPDIVASLNKNLHRHTRKKRGLQRLKTITFPFWILYAVCMVILLTVAAYWVLHFLQASGK